MSQWRRLGKRCQQPRGTPGNEAGRDGTLLTTGTYGVLRNSGERLIPSLRNSQQEMKLLGKKKNEKKKKEKKNEEKKKESCATANQIKSRISRNTCVYMHTCGHGCAQALGANGRDQPRAFCCCFPSLSPPPSIFMAGDDQLDAELGRAERRALRGGVPRPPRVPPPALRIAIYSAAPPVTFCPLIQRS